MSNSIFVDPKERLETTVYYKNSNGIVTVVTDSTKTEDGSKVQSVTVRFRRPDFQSVQIIIQASTVFGDGGIPIVDVIRARKALLYHLADGWDVKDDKGKPVPCDAAAIGSLHPAVGNALVDSLQKQLGDVSQIFAF